MTENVRTQNLRDFTVQVCRVQDDAIVGPGIAVSRDGRIVTCAQVVCAAGVERAMQMARKGGVLSTIARSISIRPALIEVLVTRCSWQAKHMKNEIDAFNDPDEALGDCVESGYRINQADVRVALGWACLANGEKEKAKHPTERTLQMSNERGDHWGKVDADEPLERLKAEE